MMNHRKSAATAGLTLLEVVIASLVASIVAGGTLMAFVASARMTTSQDVMTNAEASALAQQTIERFRNRVDAYDTWLADQTGLGWVADPLPCTSGTASNLNATSRRCYRVTAADCDGDGSAVNDCFAVETRVCWIGRTGVGACPCSAPCI